MTTLATHPDRDVLATHVTALSVRLNIFEYLASAQQFVSYLNATDPTVFTPADRDTITGTLDLVTRRITDLHVRLAEDDLTARTGRTLRDLTTAVCWSLTRASGKARQYLSPEAHSRLILLAVSA